MSRGSGASVIQQLLDADLIDEIHIDLVPVLLGAGVRLFEPHARSTGLEVVRLAKGQGVTHLDYRVFRL